ncbi:MAG: DegT/DnrJ/EryC1/StrS family aminotransferase [Terriglobia bacterium]|jgi:dTDP-4-amino-4,6-dideoxygalactose transaminase
MNSPTEIPFLDLVSPHLELREELVSVFQSALETGRFVGGSMLENFERDFADFCGVRNCIGVASGTDALRFALMGSGVNPGDIVLTVPNTFIATAEAISQAGAHVEFIDVDSRTYSMDPAKLEEYLEARCSLESAAAGLVSKKSKRPVTAIVPVHLYGQTADMDPILELAAKYNLIVVEDACQAHGARYFSTKNGQWMTAGSMGRAAAFSFYPGKNLGACGEAGAVTTNDAEVARKVRMLRDHGQIRKYYHQIEGYNGRLDSIQAGILHVKLRFLPEWNEKRRALAVAYNELLAEAGDGLVLPFEPSWSEGVYHLFVVRVQDRDQLQQYLSDAHIGTGIHYPIPLHLQQAYSSFGFKEGDFPVTEGAAREVLSLPMYPQMSADQQSEVAEKVLEFLSAREMGEVSLHVRA